MAIKQAEVRQLRQRLGWSQDELARQLGVSVNTVARWEQGRSWTQSRYLTEQLDQLWRQSQAPDGTEQV